MALPLSGLTFQVRRDGSWRCVNREQFNDELVGKHVQDPDEWIPGSEAIGRGGCSELSPGQSSEPTWWLVYGDNRTGNVSVTLVDGQMPPICTFGPLWICEWVSTAQSAYVTQGDDSYQMFDRGSRYLGDGEPD